MNRIKVRSQISYLWVGGFLTRVLQTVNCQCPKTAAFGTYYVLETSFLCAEVMSEHFEAIWQFGGFMSRLCSEKA